MLSGDHPTGLSIHLSLPLTLPFIPGIRKRSTPLTHHLQKKAMKRKWQEETDKGTTPEEAEKKYVELFTELKNKNGLKP